MHSKLDYIAEQLSNIIINLRVSKVTYRFTKKLENRKKWKGNFKTRNRQRNLSFNYGHLKWSDLKYSFTTKRVAYETRSFLLYFDILTTVQNAGTSGLLIKNTYGQTTKTWHLVPGKWNSNTPYDLGHPHVRVPSPRVLFWYCLQMRYQRKRGKSPVNISNGHSWQG